MSRHTVDDRNRLYTDGESMDKRHFAEQRSFILLYFGNHYKAKLKDFNDRGLDRVGEQAKLRLQENHIQRIIGRIKASVVNQAPDVTVGPYNENELADQKDAELSLAVMQSDKEKMNWVEKRAKIVDSYLITGEVFTLEYWDPNKGTITGWEQKTTKEGEPLFVDKMSGNDTLSATDEMGQPNEPAKGDKPIMSGELCLEVINPFNVKRDKAAQTISESPWLCIDKLVSKEVAKMLAGGDEEKLKHIAETGKDAFKVFESSNGEYVDSNDQVLLKYWFFRPCHDYPNGYYYVQCGEMDFAADELPFGIWPIHYAGFRGAPGTPRCTSIIRDLRHPAIELNRLISQQAYHTLALGDDKIITTMGSKLQKGSTWNGIRHFEVNGPAPTVMPGRDGMQFEASIQRAIKTMYDLADVDYQTQSAGGTQDAQAQLYAKLSQKNKFSEHSQNIENLFVGIWKTHMRLAKNYYADDMIVKAVGKRQALNIAEFKATADDSCEIKIVPTNDDIDSMMGKSMQLREIMQYMGKDLPGPVKARIVRNLPFLNKDNIFNEYLITEENIESDILALDRGEYRPASKADEHAEYIKRFNNRTKQGDFKLLPQQIQAMYQQRIAEHEAIAAEMVAEQKRLEMGAVPTDGPLIKIDIYDEQGKRRVAPMKLIQWALDIAEKQGMGQEQMAQLDQHNQIQILQQAQELANQGNGQAAGVQSSEPMPQYQ